LVRDAGVTIEAIAPSIEALTSDRKLTTLSLGPRKTARVPSEVAAELEGRVLRAIARLHEASPRFSAIARVRVASALADLQNDGLVSAMIDRLKTRGQVVADHRTVALAGFEPRLSQAERKLKREIADAYRAGGFTPPDPSEWTSNGGPRASTVPELLTLLRDEEVIVEIGPGLYIDRDAELDMRRKIVDRLSGDRSMTMADLRDLLGTSRKFAVPIGEYLDRIGWTRRDGDNRTLGPRAVAPESLGERAQS
jgi:selenocysteine-specific elongation factor